ncbi:MAG TPA: hypothetical protein PLZ51_00290, partial [Aggregatilineales bacterium]|nr:hypothetical protein [Aggregatilineales bacterium]
MSIITNNIPTPKSPPHFIGRGLFNCLKMILFGGWGLIITISVLMQTPTDAGFFEQVVWVFVADF